MRTIGKGIVFALNRSPSLAMTDPDSLDEVTEMVGVTDNIKVGALPMKIGCFYLNVSRGISATRQSQQRNGTFLCKVEKNSMTEPCTLGERLYLHPASKHIP